MSAARWVRKLYRGASNGGCPACGSCYGRSDPSKPCEVSTCQACGSAVCASYGLGKGQCPVCMLGLLTGWSGCDRYRCGYAGCGEQAVSAAPRVGHVCKAHLSKAKVGAGWERAARNVTLAERIAEYLEARPKNFVEVSP